MLKHLDLFSGIGGFSLGLESAGLVETVAFCDFDQYCQKVLKKNFPGVPIYGDVKELNHDKLKADGIDQIDIITGGYPCQPFSVAGRKKGEEDPRHVWPEMFRLIRELKPTWVIGENVGNHVKLGLDTVLSNLESEGYSTRTFSISASSIGANHKRERLWILAYSERNGLASTENGRSIEEAIREEQKGTNNPFDIARASSVPEARSDVANAKRLGREPWAEEPGKSENEESSNQSDHCGEGCTECQSCLHVADTGKQSESHITDSGGNGTINELEREEIGITNGESSGENVANANSSRLEEQWRPITTEEENQATQCGSWWSVEPDVGRVAHGVPNRVDRLKALGNSIVPQIPFLIGLTIRKILNNNE
jgi:DNA (cytosine-5)-methyltransferase 1